MSKWKGRRLDGPRPDKASFLYPRVEGAAAESIEFRSERRTQGDVGGEERSGESAKFCPFRLNGNPRDFLCVPPLIPYLHSMIQFYPFLRGGGCAETARVRRRHISPCMDLENLFHTPPFRSPFWFSIQRCREIM